MMAVMSLEVIWAQQMMNTGNGFDAGDVKSINYLLLMLFNGDMFTNP